MLDLTLENLREAHAGLAEVSPPTPLIPLDIPAFAAEVRIKAEHLQPIGAFKMRGAWTAVRRLDAAARSRGVVTSSSGNHGLGIAFAARGHGVRAVIVMPENAPQVKIDGIREMGAQVVLIGAVRGPEQTAEADRLAAEGMTLVPPFEHADVIAGQATCGIEILEGWPEVQTIVVPVGGGGLLAGIATSVRLIRPGVRIIAVEPAGIPKLSRAVASGNPVTLPPGTSLADGLLTRSVGELTWPLIRNALSGVVSVTDPEIRAAMQCLGAHGQRVEPSGAVTLAALIAGRIDATGPVALICSGGNVDPARYAELVA
ncbi:MAG: threonine/serine dehydratase [Gemmatimonadales bacterium]